MEGAAECFARVGLWENWKRISIIEFKDEAVRWLGGGLGVGQGSRKVVS